MKLYTRYHGIKEYKEEDVISFPKGLPGFKELKKFIIFPVEGNEVFSILHSTEDMEIGLLVVSPFYAMREYEFELEKDKEEELRITSDKDLLILSTVSIYAKEKKITTNLKAPIVININEKIGEQLILDDSKYSLKYPLLKEE